MAKKAWKASVARAPPGGDEKNILFLRPPSFRPAPRPDTRFSQQPLSVFFVHPNLTTTPISFQPPQFIPFRQFLAPSSRPRKPECVIR
jgi:hypothetical protein